MPAKFTVRINGEDRNLTEDEMYRVVSSKDFESKRALLIEETYKYSPLDSIIEKFFASNSRPVPSTEDPRIGLPKKELRLILERLDSLGYLKKPRDLSDPPANFIDRIDF